MGRDRDQLSAYTPSQSLSDERRCEFLMYNRVKFLFSYLCVKSKPKEIQGHKVKPVMSHKLYLLSPPSWQPISYTNQKVLLVQYIVHCTYICLRQQIHNIEEKYMYGFTFPKGTLYVHVISRVIYPTIKELQVGFTKVPL